MRPTCHIGLLVLACGTAIPGCSQVLSKPRKLIEVQGGGPPVLTAEERATRPADTFVSQEPGRIVPASYARPLQPTAAIRPLEEWTEQEVAQDALGRIGAAAVPSLVIALRDPDAAVRLKAVEVLGRMGEDAQGAVPDLVRLLNDPDADVRKAAARTLGRIGPAAQTAVPALMQKLFERPQSP